MQCQIRKTKHGYCGGRKQTERQGDKSRLLYLRKTEIATHACDFFLERLELYSTLRKQCYSPLTYI